MFTTSSTKWHKPRPLHINIPNTVEGCMEMRLFFGCSKDDREIVDCLMTYFNKTYEIGLDDMYNCYVGQNKFPVGENFNEYIKRAITDCDRAIIMVSRESIKRKYCLCELGAAWGLNKNIILIFVAPCKFEDLSESPFVGIQSWFVNLRDQGSISEFVECIKADKDFSAIMRKKTNGVQKLVVEAEFKEALFSIGKIHADLPPLPDYRRCLPFHADGNANTLRILTSDNEKIKIEINFFTSNPNYVGFYFDLRDTDWTGLITNNYSLSFRVEALSTIKAVKVEFKNKFPGQDLTKIGERIVTLTGNPREEIINLNSISDNVDDWLHMKELTLVFENSYITEVGTFTLSDISFVRPSQSR
ncbi:MAG TPA: toll/interleukin-1 receptor domain-containing protein [Clostridia bacterium]|nr:toll/interleukin-1 receptor domain-containing protein [Clostridia bacterium]